jgi:hypothetical protein
MAAVATAVVELQE